MSEESKFDPLKELREKHEKEINEAIEKKKAEFEDFKKALKPKDGKDADENRVIVRATLETLKRIPKPKDGKDGRNGIDADEEKIIKSILSKIPAPTKIDTRELERSILSKVPKLPDLAPISEKIDKLNENSLKKLKQLENTTRDINKRLSFQSANQNTSYGGEVDKLSLLTSDVKISSPTNGQVLTFNSTDGKWENSASSGGVTSINSLTGAVTLAAGSNITLTPAGNTVTIASTGGGVVSFTSPNSTLTVSGTTTLLADINLVNPNIWTGVQTLATTARTSGVGPYFRVVTPADTAQTASTESIGIAFGGTNANPPLTAIRQWATGALATQREYVFSAPTYAFVGVSTLVTAATVEITGAPIAGTNATITNSYALRVASGISAFSAGTKTAPGVGNINSGSGLFFNAQGNSVDFTGSGVHILSVGTSWGIRVNSGWPIGWTADDAAGTADIALYRNAAGVLEINNGSAGTYRELKLRSVIHNGVTIATLPTGVAGMVAYVTDGDSGLAWGATAVNTGAGATKYLVWYNGANWTVAGK